MSIYFNLFINFLQKFNISGHISLNFKYKPLFDLIFDLQIYITPSLAIFIPNLAALDGESNNLSFLSEILDNLCTFITKYPYSFIVK